MESRYESWCLGTKLQETNKNTIVKNIAGEHERYQTDENNFGFTYLFRHHDLGFQDLEGYATVTFSQMSQVLQEDQNTLSIEETVYNSVPCNQSLPYGDIGTTQK